MTYLIRKVPANFTSLYDFDTWVVEKHPFSGDSYLVATFEKESVARWCLNTLQASLEVRCGGEVAT